MLALLPVLAAWLQYVTLGLPEVANEFPLERIPDATPLRFPAWLRVTHYVNFLFIVLLMRSGLSILMDHPRLYRNDHCVPGSEWIRFTPVEIPKDTVWTAKEDARYISPWLGLPGYRHTIGVARHWHFMPALFWFVNGIVYVTLLFATGEWRRLIPDSWRIVPDAWAVFVHYATFHTPHKSEVLVHYNAMQQLGYFVVVFIMAPLSLLTAMAMSPSVVNRFPRYARLFGGRQSARSLHFVLLLGYLGFLVIHVTLVVVTGFARNMNHIVLGIDSSGWEGILLGFVGIAVAVAVAFFAHWISWAHPRVMQYLVRFVHLGVMRRLLFGRLVPKARYTKQDISPYFWPNGKMPDSEEWRRLAENEFNEYRLEVSGLVENPRSFSLDELKSLGKAEQITMHHCIQGWTGIAQWGGLPLAKLVEEVRPLPQAKVAVFHSFGEGLYGGEYYDTQKLETALRSESLLAYEMNGKPLPHLYGAPLRLRVENQLGYKMVKWIKSIEFVESEKDVGKGHGGKNEDDEYFDLIPDI